MSRPRAFLASLLLTALLLPGSPAPRSALAQAQNRIAATPPVAELVRQYRQIAMRGEFGGHHRRGRIIKWTGPIVVGLRGRGARRFELELVRHLTDLAELSGLRFRVLARGERNVRPNMVVTFVDRGGRGPLDLNRACSTTVYTGRGLAIVRARIRISADWSKLRRHCILEEITQALGLMNDTPYLNPSIFNDASRQQNLSPWDRMMVRAHYDPRLRPGMRWAQVRPIVADSFARQTGTGGSVGTSSGWPWGEVR